MSNTNAPESGPEVKGTITIKCPNDGSSDIEWQIDKQEFVCNYCHNLFPHAKADKNKNGVIEQGKFNGITVSDKLRNGFTVPGTLRKYKCTNCSGEIVISSKTDMSEKCSWCHRNLVMSDVVGTEFTPDGIVPFAVTKDSAIDVFKKWVKKHWFVGKGFGTNLNKLVIRPVYYPFYAVDEIVEDQSAGTGESSSSTMSGNYEITTTKIYSFDYHAKLFINDYAKPSLSEISNKVIVNQIRPFDFAKTVPFDYAYLTNFNAEMRDTEYQKLEQSIQQDISNSAIQGSEIMTKPKLGFSTTSWNHSISEDDAATAYVLAPVWLITYVDDATGKLYYFSVNGESGKVSGVLPISYLKMSIVAGIASFVAAVAAIGVSVLLMIGGAS
jgi:hypothetical protein